MMTLKYNPFKYSKLSKKRLLSLTDEQFIYCFNSECGKPGCTHSGEIYLKGLRYEFNNRNWNYSVIKNESGGFNLAKRNEVYLNENKLRLKKIENMRTETYPKRAYRHFLKYDQYCNLYNYGFIDLFFDINESTLFIKEADHSYNTERELEFPLDNEDKSFDVVLENYLINFFSYRYNFFGIPKYENSEIFSKEAFDIMYEKGLALRLVREKSAIDLYSENELIKYCKSKALHPRPVGGSNPGNWEAECPSGRNHHIMISAKFNEWGCGYCSKKGDIILLKEWYESKHKIE